MLNSNGREGGATNILAALLEARTGQQIAANRAYRIGTALQPLLRERGFASIEALAAALLADRDGTLGDAIVGALLNQESSFFRDAGVFEGLAETVEALRAQAQGRRLRIWSAGCSTGQEPLSLAMLFAERGDDAATAPDILATDVSEAALARAREGRFSQFEIQRGLPVRRMLRWFDGQGDDWSARPDLLRLVSFRRHNLVSDPVPGRFDLILCRNVLFYFSPAVRRQVFDRLAASLRPGGLLVLGAGETVIGQTDVFQPSPLHRGFYVAAAQEGRGALARSA